MLVLVAFPVQKHKCKLECTRTLTCFQLCFQEHTFLRCTTSLPVACQAKEDVQAQLEGVRKMEKKTGMTVGGDGWSDCKRQPLLNLLAISPGGSRFIGAVNTQGNEKPITYGIRSVI